MIKLGQTARHLRTSKGLTQKAAAHQLDVSVVHLCNIENNKSAPSADLLERYRDLWGIDLYVLAWCLHGDAEKLPKEVRKPMKELARVWQKQLGQVVVGNRKKASFSCSPSNE